MSLFSKLLESVVNLICGKSGKQEAPESHPVHEQPHKPQPHKPGHAQPPQHHAPPAPVPGHPKPHGKPRQVLIIHLIHYTNSC